MTRISAGTRVIHDGMEKTVSESHGDILVLNDKSCVSNNDVAVIGYGPESAEEVTPVDECNEEMLEIQKAEKEALRTRIESITVDISATDLFAITEKVGIIPNDFPKDPTKNTVDIERLKNHLLIHATESGMIDHKICETCGQRISYR
jgi:hypothetical protein